MNQIYVRKEVYSKMKKYGIIALVISLIVLLGFAFAAEKGAKKDPIAEKQALAKAVKVNMADALAIATKQVSGTVLNAEVEDENGKVIYSFEILPTLDSKIIKEVNIDAATGAIVATEDETGTSEAKEVAEEKKEGKEKGEKMSEESKEKDSDDEEKEEKMSEESKEKDSDNEENEEEGEQGDEGKWEALKVKVAADKLPAAVQSAIAKEVSGGKIESATTMPKLYSVKVTKGEESSELLITAEGKVIENEKSGKEDDEKDEKGEKDEKD